MALLTEPTNSPTIKKRRNSQPGHSSGSSSPDYSQLLGAIESLKERIESIESKKELDDEDREALAEAKAALKAKKAALAQPSNEPAPSVQKSRRLVSYGTFSVEEDDDE